MVFKGRFFSSKKSSDTSNSPGGSSNSPGSVGSNSSSPIRSNKKKPMPLPASTSSSSKDKERSPSSSASTPVSLLKKNGSSFKPTPASAPPPTSEISGPAPSKSKKPETQGSSLAFPTLVASSLGLNKIKTRSGPLPQESFFGFGKEKGASNLSKVGVVREIRSSKYDKGIAVNGRDSDESEEWSDQSPHAAKQLSASRLNNGKPFGGAGRLDSAWASSDECTPELKTSYDCDNPKESESPRFQAILRLTSAPRKRFPGDIKSFSHELNSKGVRPYPFWKPRRHNNLEEVLAMIRAKFNKEKEEVDSELHLFAADLVGILDKNADTHPEWQETIEDLLVLTRSCAMTPPGEFWLQCEGIVQELDDRRQEHAPGILKQLHTRMLFILTRCTRLLQFHKESSLPEDENVFLPRQSLQPEDDKNLPPANERDVKASNLEASSKAASSTKKSFSQEQSRWKSDHTVDVSFQSSPVETSKSSEGKSRMKSLKKFSSPSVKSPKEASSGKAQKEALKVAELRRGLSDALLASAKVSEGHSANDSHGSKHHHKLSWGYWGEQPSAANDSSIICRICEEEVPTLHVEDHSRICAIADRCDQKGLKVDERLIRIAETLEKLAESLGEKDLQLHHAVSSTDGVKVSNLRITEEPEPLISAKQSDWSRRGSEDLLDCIPEADNPVSMDDIRAQTSTSCRSRFGPKSDQGMATSSAGSATPKSPLMTPKMNPIDLLLSGKGSFSEHGDLPQMNELADIARCVANTPLDDDRSLQYLLTCLEDLKTVIDNRKFESLTVDTFGARIENLIREKYLQLCELVDDAKVDITSAVIDEDAPLEDDVLHSLRSSPVHPSRDRTSIDDFEIIKPISRGAFGRVFLAKKRTTGDLFAIKVLKKADMIRKNAVESILAERDILITVRNPFVVRFFYSFTCRENLYLVMEYLNGGDLYSLLRNLGCLDEDIARVYIAEVVLALEYLHSLSVVHRDLKPDNLLIAHDGHIKLTDFGLSKVGLINSTDDLSGPAVSGTSSLMEEDEPTLTASQHQQERRKNRSAVGTPDYLAPEILLGTGHAFTADWWSVGVILFELIVGIPPFNAEHPQKIFDNILNRKIPWPQVPDEMSYEAYDLIDGLLTEDPNQRLGAGGASEVKQHPFFRDINWDTLARQKAAFVPASESAIDTSYFKSRISWNPSDEHVYAEAATDSEDSSDNGSMSVTSSCLSNPRHHDELGDDECDSGLTEIDSSCDIDYSFSNFSFKNLSQLASINYDLLTKGLKDDAPSTSGA